MAVRIRLVVSANGNKPACSRFLVGPHVGNGLRIGSDSGSIEHKLHYATLYLALR